MADESGKKSKLNTTEEFPNEAEDRISALPDSLLLHILSFLSTKEVVRTCLLSQRWQFLWTDISEIHLVEESEDIAKVRSFVDCVGRMLVACNGKCLNKFAVDFCYDKCFASNVKLWVRFAVKNKVKNITLRCGQFPQYECKLPQMLYSHSSMTSLTVNFSVMAPRGAIKWGSLKSLSIGLVRLEARVMEKILSGCPVLEVLHLKECWGLSYLNISSPKLATLLIEDWELYDIGEEYFLEISAPYVLDLSIIDSKGGYEYKLRNVSSVVRARLNFDYPYIEEITDPIPSAMDYMKGLLESLQSVKELEMGPWCVEVLSLLEMKGQLPPSTRWCLTLDVWAHKRSIAGILGILKSSPKLERLVIKGKPFPIKETEPYYLDAVYLQNANLDLVAFHVKTVKITSFKESFCSGEPMATLVQLLLKGATALEKMVISAEELDINKLARTLISFPRASSKAVIVFD